MSAPLVSIGLPVFNGEEYVREAVESILSQDHTELELIISDNASTDATGAICRELAAGDSRIHYQRNTENLGASRNYNLVFEMARGRFFKWAAHDDVCHRSLISSCLEVLEQAPQWVAMVYPRAALIDEQGRLLQTNLDHIECRAPEPHVRLAHLLRSLNMCDPIFGLYRKEYLKRTRLIGPFFGADNVLLGELALMGEIWEVSQILFYLRSHSRRSMQANRSARACAAWYSPSAGRKLFILPNWERMVIELIKSVRRARLSRIEKAKCYSTIIRTHYGQRLRNAGGAFKRRVCTRFRPPYWRTQ